MSSRSILKASRNSPNSRRVLLQIPSTELKPPISELSKSNQISTINLNDESEWTEKSKSKSSNTGNVPSVKPQIANAQAESKNGLNVKPVKLDIGNKFTDKTLPQELRKQTETVDTWLKPSDDLFEMMNIKNENVQFCVSNIDKKNTDLQGELNELKIRKLQWRAAAIKYKNQYEELIEEKKKMNIKSVNKPTPVEPTPVFTEISAQLKDQFRQEGRQQLEAEMNYRIKKLNRQIISLQGEIHSLLVENRVLKETFLEKEIRTAEQIDLKQCEIDRLLVDINIFQDTLLDKEVRAAEQIDLKQSEIERLLADIKVFQDTLLDKEVMTAEQIDLKQSENDRLLADIVEGLRNIIREKEMKATEANDQGNNNEKTYEKQIQRIRNATKVYTKGIFIEIFYLNVIVTIYVIFYCVRWFFQL